MTGKVAILGGGAIGCSIAFHLAREGIPSQVIEKDAIASQASGKAMGYVSTGSMMLVENEFMPRDCHWPCLGLAQESSRRFPQLALELKERAGIDIHFGELPMLIPAFREEGAKQLQERLSQLQSRGLEMRWLDGDELRAMGTGLAPETRGAIFCPGAQVEAYRYVLALAQAAEARGATIRQGQAVGFRTQKSRVTAVVLSSGTEIGGEAFVIAMGPWSKLAASWLGKEIPLELARAQCLKLEVAQRFPPYMYARRVEAIMPKVDGSVLLGYTEDQAGFDDRPTEEAKRMLLSYGLRLLPQLAEARLVEHRAGLLGYSPDALPLVGRLPGWDNVYIAAGLGTWGIFLSPAVGRVIAQLIARDRLERTIEPMSPARFSHQARREP